MKRTPANFQDLTGRRFGRLTVLRRSSFTDGSPDVFWDCRCDCGAEIVTRANSLRRGATRSCGCLRAETAAVLAKRIRSRVQYLTVATTPDGIRHLFPSMKEAAAFFGMAVSTVAKCVYQDKPYLKKNITFKIEKA